MGIAELFLFIQTHAGAAIHTAVDSFPFNLQPHRQYQYYTAMIV